MRTVPAHSARAVRLYVLDTGLIACSDFALFSPTAAPGTRRDMTVRSYLVVHPNGTLLWDTGIADAIAGKRGGERITDAIVFHVPKTLGAQLSAIGHATVDRVGLSHMHIDHVGNLDQFPAAPVVVQAADYDAAYGPRPEQAGFMPETYAALDRRRIVTIAGENDVFGDGTVVMTPLPGHTPGHQGLLVRLRESGPILLATDIAYSARDYELGAVREANFDLDQSRASIERAKRLGRELGAAVWLHHDADAQRAIRTAPAYYE